MLPWATMLEMEMRDWLTRGLRQLPLDQRLTLQLGYQLGLCPEEIAAITEVPIGTVKARQFLARSKLRRYLPTLGGGPQFFFGRKANYPRTRDAPRRSSVRHLISAAPARVCVTFHMIDESSQFG